MGQNKMLVDQCAIIRCTEVGDAEKKIKDSLSGIFPVENIFYVVNCENTTGKGNTLILNLEFMRNCKLSSNIPKVGWRCGDYAFYRMLKHDDSFNYYWIFESDIAFTVEGIRNFINSVTSAPIDLIAPYFRSRDESWSWSKRLKRSYPSYDVYGCLFPMVRVSREALSFMFKERIKLSAKVFTDDDINNYPNDESFTSSILKNNGFVCEPFKGLDRSFFGLTRIHRSNIDDTVISHPVMDRYADMAQKSRASFRSASNQLINEFQKNILVNNGDVNVFNTLNWLTTDIQINNSSLNNVPAMHCVTGRNVESDADSLARVGDFILAGGGLLKKIDYSRFSPYSFENGLLYLVDTHAKDFEHSSLYKMQRSGCSSLIKTRLCDIKLPSIDKSKLTFVFSTGDSTSEHLSRLVVPDNSNNIFEADVFSGVSDPELVYKSVQIFLQHYSMNKEETCFHFRADMNRNVDIFIDVFNDSNFIFIYCQEANRNKSLSSGDSPSSNCEQELDVLKKLVDSNVKLKVVTCDDLIGKKSHFPSNVSASFVDLISPKSVSCYEDITKKI